LSLQQQAKQLQFHQQQLRIDGQAVQLRSWQRLPSLCIITLNHSQPLKCSQLWLWQDSMPNESWRQLQHWLKFYAAR
ncbi:MAG: protein YgfX, partial [Pseudomonadota bacterium]|nr:protein YgfX [Pseudomonadota bacterium]